MPLLDELSGFEFEDTMELVFTKMGYENVRQSRKTADEGRDIIMEDPNKNGPPTALIVECKHTDSVGRPVVQKLDSAVKTYDHNGPKRGMIATTGRFTQPAKEYAEEVSIELLDGTDIRDVADDIGMDLYNGRVEIICESALNPYHPKGPCTPFLQAFEDVRNLDREAIPDPQTTLTMSPVITARTHVQRAFETGAGVIHRVNNKTDLTIDASRDGPALLGDPVRKLVVTCRNDEIPLDEGQLETYFDTVNLDRFGMTETEYRDWLAEREAERHSQVVTYTGDNNVTYEKECDPRPSDVNIQEFNPTYAPRIFASVVLNEYIYQMDWFCVGEHISVVSDRVRYCVHCEGDVEPPKAEYGTIPGLTGILSKTMTGSTYTYCANCGAIACQAHTRTEATTGDPVCTGCAETARFMGAKKYFFNHTNRKSYEEEYAEKPIYEKAAANVPATVGSVLLLIFMAALFLL